MDDGPAQKKAKVSPEVLTFGLSNSPVRVQLLSSHTVHDLCDTFCEHTRIGRGDGESVWSHMWNVTVSATGRCYESGDMKCMSALRAEETKLGSLELGLPGPNATLSWMYDYGSTSYYNVTLLEKSTLNDDESDADYPRKLAAAAPAGYIKYSPQDAGLNLNETFADLNSFGFVGGHHASLSLFQPPRKNNHAFVERDKDGVSHMLLMPAAPPKDLAAHLHCLDAGVRLGQPKFDDRYQCPVYSWYSMIILPAESANDRLEKRWGQNLEVGFCEMKVVPADASRASLNETFPKLAALAGFVKDKKVPKGWLTFKEGALRICTGKSKSPKSGAPNGTACVGAGQHEPENNDGVLFMMEVPAASLHDLFCVAEGLLRSL